MNDIRIYVVISENFEEFKKEFEAKNGGDPYVAISVKDYENLQKTLLNYVGILNSKNSNNFIL